MFRGLKMWFTHPGLLATGLIPALITGIVYGFLALVLAFTLWPFSEWVVAKTTPFEGALAALTEIVLAIALVLAIVFLMIRTFTTITLWLGQRFYRRVSVDVDALLGTPLAPVIVSSPAFAGIPRLLLRLLKESALGLLAFIVGLAPLIGSFLSAIGGALLGGRGLARELTEAPLERRGIAGVEQDRVLAENRSLVRGFGVTAYLFAAIPFAAVFVLPAAVAGGTLLARRLAGESIEPV